MAVVGAAGTSPSQASGEGAGSPPLVRGQEKEAEAHPGWLKWVMLFTTALIYINSFFTRVAPSAIIEHLETDFGVSRTILGTLSSEYFYLYVVFQVPWGAGMARFGVRRILIAGTVLALLGHVLFCLAPGEWLLHVGRLLIGVGVSCVFMSWVTIIKEWFPPSSAAMLMGVCMSFGVGGGILGQAPLTAAANEIGWRWALLVPAVIPLSGVIVAVLVMKDFGPYANRRASLSLAEQWSILWRLPQLWLVAVVGMLLNATIMSFNGLWATPFLQVKYGITAGEAGLISSSGFLGSAIGGPVFGQLSDRFSKHRKWFLIGALLSQTLCAAALIYLPVPQWMAYILSFILGACVTINLLLATVRAYMRSKGIEHTIALGGSCMNTLFLASPAYLQPIVGAILDARAGDAASSVADYHAALVVFPACTGLATLLALWTRETAEAGSKRQVHAGGATSESDAAECGQTASREPAAEVELAAPAGSLAVLPGAKNSTQ